MEQASEKLREMHTHNFAPKVTGWTNLLLPVDRPIELRNLKGYRVANTLLYQFPIGPAEMANDSELGP